VATYRTLIALLAVTGMRIGEAISLDCGDFDAASGLLIIRNGKVTLGSPRSVRCSDTQHFVTLSMPP
jgi:integrase